MDYKNIRFVVEAGTAFITLNRPEALNSFTVEMHLEFRDALTRCADDQSIRCVLLTGEGRGFCAGQDLNDRAVAPGEASPDLGDSVEKYYNPVVRMITSMEKPVICAVNGVAAGAGANIALACDIVIAARSASFIESFCKLGLIPDSGGTWHLPRLLGMARAKAVAMLGPKISAEQAKEWGMIWDVIDDDQLVEQSREMATTLAAQPTKGFAFTKQALYASATNTLDEQLELEKELMRAAGQTQDYKAGVDAFMNKRTPEFVGR
ncbi:2-(1,2-epoxy-1,2-dihydrophenyl)acetyl-CoA isomerase PaaG [Spongiibacter tropicus]|uniref:2-(1,2-epoxy-1,2-dihydrophenyl)acetyl-CoA isomerase PaaG n=1 Tax=Spongiibacter tropicus TaxID=454602 RepID=UPI0003B5513F|nr:2-(1,2-epoxy-1,2-dihydrophenyl)acetyl-CoA isomerase PaaG [Spongiibacter tropicus]